MLTLFQDLVIGARLLRRNPAFAAAAVLTLAIGVGVNAAVFSVLHAILLRPLPVPDGSRIAVLATTDRVTGDIRGVSAADLWEYRSITSTAFEDITGYDVGFLTLSPGPREAHRVLVTWVVGNYFTTLGVQPAAGRLLGPDDVVAGRESPVVVLGFAAWQQRFRGDASIVGKSVRVNGRWCTVVGVAPQSFRGTFAFTDSELFLPVTWSEPRQELGTQHAVARLKDGVSIEQATATMDVVQRRLEADRPDDFADQGLTVVREPLARPEERAARWSARAGTVAFALVGLVLMVAIVNVANLMLGRSVDRRRELTIRAALGAGRLRLARQLITESLLLAVIGGAVGLVLARWTAGVLPGIIRLPGDKPVHFDFSFDGRVLVYAVAVTLVTGLLAGVAPAFQGSRVDLTRSLRGMWGVSRRVRNIPVPLRGALIVVQLAACFVVLLTAGLLTRSLAGAERIELGFRPEGLLNVSMDVQQLSYDESRGRAFFAALEERIRAIPTVQHVAFANNVPLGYVRLNEPMFLEGRPPAPGPQPLAGVNWVSPDYFATMGIRIVKGRSLETDEERPVAVVNTRFAETAWPGEDAIGRRFSTRDAEGPWVEVVGIAETGKYDFVFEAPQPYVYYPLEQWATGAIVRTLHVRSSEDPKRLIPDVTRAVRDLEPELALFDVITMEEALGGGLGFFLVRTAATFVGILGMLAAALAVVGVYGVVASATARRTQEIGVRMTMGATRHDIARLVIGQAAVLIASGIGVGFSVWLLVAGIFDGLLFGVSPRDPASSAAVAALLAACSLGACAIPWWRAVSVSPATALRDE
jgi:predicted permease